MTLPDTFAAYFGTPVRCTRAGHEWREASRREAGSRVEITDSCVHCRATLTYEVYEHLRERDGRTGRPRKR